MQTTPRDAFGDHKSSLPELRNYKFCRVGCQFDIHFQLILFIQTIVLVYNPTPRFDGISANKESGQAATKPACPEFSQGGAVGMWGEGFLCLDLLVLLDLSQKYKRILRFD